MYRRYVKKGLGEIYGEIFSRRVGGMLESPTLRHELAARPVNTGISTVSVGRVSSPKTVLRKKTDTVPTDTKKRQPTR